MSLESDSLGRPMAPIRVLVTGGTGFLGDACCDRLVAAGGDDEIQVHALSRQGSGYRQSLEERPGFHWRQVNLLDENHARRLDELIGTFRPTHLLHLAWASGAEGFGNSPENFRWIGPSLELLRIFREHGGRRVVCVGTGAEYDWSDGVCHERTTPLRPTLTYGLCKRTFGELFERYCEQTGLSGAWARLFFLFGPNEEPRRLVASTILSLLRGEPARCNYDRLRRDYLHIGDAADGLVTLLFSDIEGPINLASGEALSLGDLVRTTAERVGHPELVELGGLPKEGDSDGPAPLVVADIGRARRELGWQPTTPLDVALDRTIDSFRDSSRP